MDTVHGPRSGTGSSPLARGTLLGVRRQPLPERFIPARAGNTSWGSTARGTASVHPRSRGEHDELGQYRWVVSGSSPLARGTRAPEHRGEVLPRFIPARAGNTCCACSPRTRRPVHPRSRGEHTGDSKLLHIADGSSPLARGTRPGVQGGGGADRFIPARAGNTRTDEPATRTYTVHPRSRGEHHSNAARNSRVRGSSPLARGTL